MEENRQQHFPEDRDAPKIMESFYSKNKNLFDFAIFVVIALSTTLTVSFSLYIIISKYF